MVVRHFGKAFRVVESGVWSHEKQKRGETLSSSIHHPISLSRMSNTPNLGTPEPTGRLSQSTQRTQRKI
jgi:hypothetical protein